MSQESTTELSATGAGAGKPSPDPLVFFQTILVNMTSKLEVDWDVVAKQVGYNSAHTARVRFRQMQRKFTEVHYGVPLSPSPSVARGLKTNGNVGSGTNRSPSKVAKFPAVKSKLQKIHWDKSTGSTTKENRVKLEKGEAEDDVGGEISDESFQNIAGFMSGFA